jgi:hypothetical protein
MESLSAGLMVEPKYSQVDHYMLPHTVFFCPVSFYHHIPCIESTLALIIAGAVVSLQLQWMAGVLILKVFHMKCFL